MISGQISPKDIGLTSEAQVVSLVRRADVMFEVIRVLVDRVAIVVVFLAYFVPGFQNSSIVESIVYVLPNTIWCLLFVHYCYNFLFYQMSYLYIMCSYLKMKIGSVDEEMKQSVEQRRRSLMLIIRRFSVIIVEINEYNTTYWSKYLFFFWLTFGTVDISLLLTVVLSHMNRAMRITYSFVFFYSIAVFLIVILTTASVNSTVNRM